jgi:C4-dicarboxylate-specific signal transduction histidine kinase
MQARSNAVDDGFDRSAFRAEEEVSLVRHEASRHGVAMRLEPASGLLLVRGDRIELEQVIINLAVNGVQAMATVTDRGRVLIVRTRPPQSDRVIVAVEDIGVGIKPENCRPAFQRILHHQARGVFSLQG